MAVQTPSRAPSKPRSPADPAADVIKDAQARQRRHRRTGVAVLLIAAAGATGALAAGGGGADHRYTSGQPRKGSPFSRSAVIRLARGRSTGRFVIHAPADHAYRVRMTAPPHSRIRLTMRIDHFSGWSLALPGDHGCTTTTIAARCTLNFAAGGNPGGIWTATLYKTAGPTGMARVTITFAPYRGDFHG